MKSRSIKALVSALVAVGSMTSLVDSAIAQNLLTNGSFETFKAGDGDGTLLYAGSTDLTGWTVIGGVVGGVPTNNLLLCATGGICSNSASDGNYFLDLTGITNTSPYTGVSQTINTVLGQTYTLTFSQGGRADSLDTSVLATAGGSSQTFNSTSASYITDSLTFTGTGGPTVISLLGTAASGLDLNVDNVVVTGPTFGAVPEPGTWELMLVGAALMGAALRKGRHKPVPAMASA